MGGRLHWHIVATDPPDGGRAAHQRVGALCLTRDDADRERKVEEECNGKRHVSLKECLDDCFGSRQHKVI